MRIISLFLLPLVLAAFFAGSADVLAESRKDSDRCFVIIESASETMGGTEGQAGMALN